MERTEETGNALPVVGCFGRQIRDLVNAGQKHVRLADSFIRSRPTATGSRDVLGELVERVGSVIIAEDITVVTASRPSGTVSKTIKVAIKAPGIGLQRSLGRPVGRIRIGIERRLVQEFIAATQTNDGHRHQCTCNKFIDFHIPFVFNYFTASLTASRISAAKVEAPEAEEWEAPRVIWTPKDH